MRRIFCLLLMALLLTLADNACLRPAGGQSDAAPDTDAQRIYIGQGQTLLASPARQLSWRAHVSEFQYQPRSLEAAYTGTQTDGDTATSFVRLVGFLHGTTTTLLSATGPNTPDDMPGPYDLIGWSGDGRYLLVSHYEAADNADGTPADPTEAWDAIDVGVEPFKVRSVPLAQPGEASGQGMGVTHISPSAALFAEEWASDTNASAHKLTVLIYDPARDSLRRIAIPARAYLLGWIDNTHLALLLPPGAGARHVSHDIVTGAETPTKRLPADPAPVPRANPDVRLSLAPTPFAAAGPDAKSQTYGIGVWLTIAAKRPKLPAVCLGLNLGEDDPRALLAPNESAALWLEHGDLFQASFAVGDATTRELYDAGEKLSCDEERQIAEENVKQIGLGLMQYSQDYDEQFPAAQNFHDGVYPYIKSDQVFSMGNAAFNYTPPANLVLANIDNVTTTVLGTLTLPCAMVTLYADGHVKALPPAQKAPYDILRQISLRYSYHTISAVCPAPAQSSHCSNAFAGLRVRRGRPECARQSADGDAQPVA